MKKIISILVSVLLTMGMSIPIFAASVQPEADGLSIQETISGGVVASTNIADTMNKGDSFQVTFNEANFTWADTGEYGIGKFGNNWVRMESDAFSNTGVVVNPQNGDLTITLQTVRAYSGTFKIWLDSGAVATSALEKAITVTDIGSKISKTKSGGAEPVCTSHSGPVSLKTGESITWSFAADSFEWNPINGTKNASLLQDASWIKITGASTGTDFEVHYSTSAGNSGVVDVTITALKAASYSKLQVYLQGGGGTATKSSPPMQVTVTESGSGKINGIAADARLGGKWSGAMLNGRAISYSELYSLEVRSGDELLLPFSAGFFTWDGTTPYEGSSVTTSQLRSGKIKLSTSQRKGTQAFKSGSPELVQQNGRAYVKIEFSKDNQSVRDIDFSMTLYLTVDGQRHTASQLEIDGTFTQDVYEVYKDSDYADISDGEVVEAVGSVRGIQLYLGSGVTVHANLISGTKYSGTAAFETSAADEKIIAKFPSIEQILVLKTANLDRSANRVSFDMPEANYYVYGSNGGYLGRSNERLAYSNKYYFSTKSIDMSETDGGDELENPGYVEPETEFPPSINDNPPTGR